METPFNIESEEHITLWHLRRCPEQKMKLKLTNIFIKQ